VISHDFSGCNVSLSVKDDEGQSRLYALFTARQAVALCDYLQSIRPQLLDLEREATEGRKQQIRGKIAELSKELESET
jgi:hypothetical protein